jgi:hypothetical protein
VRGFTVGGHRRPQRRLRGHSAPAVALPHRPDRDPCHPHHGGGEVLDLVGFWPCGRPLP